MRIMYVEFGMRHGGCRGSGGKSEIETQVCVSCIPNMRHIPTVLRNFGYESLM